MNKDVLLKVKTSQKEIQVSSKKNKNAFPNFCTSLLKVVE